MMLGAHLLVCQMSPTLVWSWCLVAAAALLFSVYGEALYGLEVQGIEVLILLGAFYVPSMAPESQQDF
jgi:hypothetical protein